MNVCLSAVVVGGRARVPFARLSFNVNDIKKNAVYNLFEGKKRKKNIGKKVKADAKKR